MEDALTFEQFRVFLDLNGFVRTMFLRAMNPYMWAIDPTGKPLPKHLLSKGTALEIAIETQRQFLYQLRSQDYEEALREHEANVRVASGGKSSVATIKQNALNKRQAAGAGGEEMEGGDDEDRICIVRKCCAFKLRVLTQQHEGGPPQQQSKIIGG